jgi:heme exporter protein A
MPTYSLDSTFTGTNLACVRSTHPIFTKLSFRLDAGQTLRLTGHNGSGKSSLLRLVAGLIKPFKGILAWNGKTVTDLETHYTRLAYVSHLDAIKPTITAFSNLSFWSALSTASADSNHVKEALDRFGIGTLADIPGRYLSSGQKRRLVLARLLSNPVQLWLLDEPAVALDRDGIARLEFEIELHCKAGGMVMLVTHSQLSVPNMIELCLESFTATDLRTSLLKPDKK